MSRILILTKLKVIDYTEQNSYVENIDKPTKSFFDKTQSFIKLFDADK